MSYGSYDLMLANPPEGLSDAAPCVCGHRLEDHEEGYDPGRCQWTPNVYRDGGEWDHNPCDCPRFELDEA